MQEHSTLRVLDHQADIAKAQEWREHAKCTRRSENPSLKRPGCPVAPE
jgi:hypothetical protein